jgi:hypothetical protein
MSYDNLRAVNCSSSGPALVTGRCRKKILVPEKNITKNAMKLNGKTIIYLLF